MIRGLKIVLALIVVGVGVLLIGLVAGLVQNAFISGVQVIDRLGDTVIVSDDTMIDDDEIVNPYEGEGAQTTVPPGDDPSWSDEMPQAPVEWPAESGWE